jgi:2-hydroxychromene-2-carboxylate isomerase
MSRVQFWYEFASTYSYPAAMRIGALAAERSVELEWRPFLLGPLFVEAGWRDSPFNIYPVKGRYMWRDLERICAALDLPLARPEPFPQNSLLAARVAISLEGPTRAEFSRRVYQAEFGEKRPISEPSVIAGLAEALQLEGPATLAAAQHDANKARLKAACEEAKTLGLPGAPCLVTEEGEVFWGNDRLEQGLDWAIGKR